jgi:polysaccharide deacetylase family sporulation protein PdaB
LVLCNIVFLKGAKAFHQHIIFCSFDYERGIVLSDYDFNPSSSAIYKVQTGKRELVLTFDISWGEKSPDLVLTQLEQNGVNKATFFLSASWVSTHPDVVKRIISLGYEIGSHGDQHINYTEYSNEYIKQQVKKAEEAISAVTGVKTRLIRTPNGDINQRVLRVLHSMGYVTIQWSVDSLDWKNPGVDYIVSRVLSQAESGSIILLHASDTAEQTGEALPRIIDGLRTNGYDFVTISNLVGKARKNSP